MINYMNKSDITAILDEAVEKINSLPGVEDSTFYEKVARERLRVIEYQKSKISNLIADIGVLKYRIGTYQSLIDTIAEELNEARAKLNAVKSLVEES